MTTTEISLKSNAVAVKREEMNLFMDMAKQFSKANAFPKCSPEQLFVLMKAGQEMGMSEIESLNSLYIVNGKIEPYGKAMTAKIVEDGYQLSYEDETDSQVTVVATKGKHVIRETVKDTDKIIQNSRAKNFSKKNKMRYHGLRMILNFHLAHLIRSVPDLYDADAISYNGGTQDAEYEEVKPELTVEEAEGLLSEVNTIDHLRELHGKITSEFVTTNAIDNLFAKRSEEIKSMTAKNGSAKPQTEVKTQSEPKKEERKDSERPKGKEQLPKVEDIKVESVQESQETEPAEPPFERNENPDFGEPLGEAIEDGPVDPIEAKIQSLKSTPDLMAYYKELKAQGKVDLTKYSPLFTQRRKEIENG